MRTDFLISKKNAAEKLIESGQSPWLDNISRCIIDSGELAALVKNSIITGITSNPSIFEKSINSGKCGYPEMIREMSSKGLDTFSIYDAITQKDIKDAAKILFPVYLKTGGSDGFVSIEVPPDIASDTVSSVREAKRIFASVASKNVLIKIPATKEGLPAITELISNGVNVNVTLMFSLKHYTDASSAYIEGLNSAVKNGVDLKNIHSVASVFVSRIDTFIDRQLDGLAKNETGSRKKSLINLKGKAAVANSKIIFKKHLEIINGERFKTFKSLGANIQKPLWASTSTKNPDYYDLKYVEPLIGKNTINTLPDVTLEALCDHGLLKADTIFMDLDAAEKTIKELSYYGINLDNVGETLQEQGVKAFEDSYEKLLCSIKNVK